MPIAVDAMGGDFAPQCAVEGAVSAAVESGELTIRASELRLPALEPEKINISIGDDLHAELGSAELSDVIVEVDSQVRFSWTLLCYSDWKMNG